MSDISSVLAKDFPQLLELLTSANYILCLPEGKILKECDYDYSFFSNSLLKFIDEHLCQVGQEAEEMQSLSGKNYIYKDQKLVAKDSQEVFKVLVNDNCYVHGSN